MKSKPITLFTLEKLNVRKGNKSQLYSSEGKDFTQYNSVILFLVRKSMELILREVRCEKQRKLLTFT